MNQIWNHISAFGIRPDTHRADVRNIKYTNHLLASLSFFSSFLSLVIYINFGWWVSAPLSLTMGGVFLLLLFLNKLGYTFTSRMILNIFFPLSILGISILSKMAGTSDTTYQVQPYEFFEFRFLMIITPLVPLTVFNLRQSMQLTIGLVVSFLAIMLYDPIHVYFGVGYSQVGLIKGDYSFTNIIVFAAFAILVVSVLFLKRINESLDKEKEVLIDQLNLESKELKRTNKALESRNEEIKSQAEEIHANQEKLEEANQIIEDQHQKLAARSKDLESEIIRKNQELVASNKELIKHNSELRQFSHTVSHNLRGPLASILGLVNLMEVDSSKGENDELVDRIKNSANSLDTIIKDLNKIIDIRHNIFEVKEKVVFEQQVNEVLDTLQGRIKESNATVEQDFQASPFIYSIKALVSSIIYNLLSNSIKFRSPDRSLAIKISTRVERDFTILEVTDNGLGIDLETHQQDIFGMYKRFHLHTDGRGIGLYLVRLQAETLGGKVRLKSKINQGSTFSVFFKNLEEEDFEIHHENDKAKVFYDSLTNTAGIQWKGDIDGETYRTMAQKNIELVRKYHVPNWISDLRKQNEQNPADQQWMIENIMPEAVEYGLKRVAIITLHDNFDGQLEYLKHISEQSQKLGLTTQIFQDLAGARNWLIQFNKSSVK